MVVLILVAFWLVASSATFLIVDHPVKSDVILVLAGETNQRPTRALELLQQGFGSRVVFNVPADAKIYGSTYVQLAEKWAAEQPQASALSICPTHGLSTKEESLEAGECLRKFEAKSVLLVTSDFHTRRALSIFQRELPDWTFSVAAAYDEEQFGVPWWKHRQWAKTNVDEWLRVFWWEAVDRWVNSQKLQHVLVTRQIDSQQVTG